MISKKIKQLLQLWINSSSHPAMLETHDTIQSTLGQATNWMGDNLGTPNTARMGSNVINA